MLEERSDEEACEGVGEHRDGPPRVRQETPDNEPAARRFRRDCKRRAGIRRGRRARQARPAFDGGRREGRSRPNAQQCIARRERPRPNRTGSPRRQGAQAPQAQLRHAHGEPLVQPAARCRVGALAGRPGGAVRRAPHHTRLRVELPGHRRMGHGVPRAHRGGHAAGGRGAGRHVLHGVRHGHAAHVPGQLRRAHLPGVGP